MPDMTLLSLAAAVVPRTGYLNKIFDRVDQLAENEDHLFWVFSFRHWLKPIDLVQNTKCF